MGFSGGGGLTKITLQSQIANGLLGDPLMAALGISTADLAANAVTAAKIAANSLADAQIVPGGISTVSLGVDTRGYWGRYLRSMRETGNTTQAAVANRVFLQPIHIPRKMTLDQIILAFGTGSGNINVGIYADNGDTPAGGVLQTSSGSFPMPATSPSIGAINKQLAQGLYWLAVIHDNATANFIRCHALNVFGAQALNGCFYDAGSFAFTTPCPAVTNDNLASPYMWVRALSFDA